MALSNFDRGVHTYGERRFATAEKRDPVRECTRAFG